MPSFMIHETTAAAAPLPAAGKHTFFVDSADGKFKKKDSLGNISNLEDTDVLAAITANDTDSGYLDDKIVVSGGLSKTILNPGANEQIQISAASKAIFQAHQQTLQNPVTSPTPFLCDLSQVNTDPATIGYVAGTGEITLNKATNFKITATLTCDTADGSRQSSKLQMQIDTGAGFVDLPTALGPSQAYGYHRNNASGENTCILTAIYPPFVVGTRIRFMISTINAGTIRTVPQGCAITVEEL